MIINAENHRPGIVFLAEYHGCEYSTHPTRRNDSCRLNGALRVARDIVRTL